MPKGISEEERAEYIRDNYPNKPLLHIADDLGVSRRVAEDWVKDLGLGVRGIDYTVEEHDDLHYKEHLEWVMERPNTKLSSVQAKEIDNSEYYVRVVKKYNRKNYKNR